MRLLISTIYLLRAITSISLALAEPFGYNNHNDQTVIDTERILVPGPNPVGAYYCGPESKHHLFRISQLTVAPFPIPVAETVFLKIQGTASPDPDLIFARLNITVQIDDNKPGWHEERLWHYPLTSIGYRTIYGLPLQGGPFPVDIVASYEFPGYFFCNGHYTLTADAKMDTGQGLFCIVVEFDLPGERPCNREVYTLESGLGLEGRNVSAEMKVGAE